MSSLCLGNLGYFFFPRRALWTFRFKADRGVMLSLRAAKQCLHSQPLQLLVLHSMCWQRVWALPSLLQLPQHERHRYAIPAPFSIVQFHHFSVHISNVPRHQPLCLIHIWIRPPPVLLITTFTDNELERRHNATLVLLVLRLISGCKSVILKPENFHTRPLAGKAEELHYNAMKPYDVSQGMSTSLDAYMCMCIPVYIYLGPGSCCFSVSC